MFMKKYLLIIPIAGLMFACSGNSNNSDQNPEESQMQIEAVEESTQNLDETIESSEDEMIENQAEIDSLLNDI